MKKTKKFHWFDWAKTYWPAVAILTFLIGFASHITLVWSSPQEIDKTNQALKNLSNTINGYVAEHQADDAAEKAANEQRDFIIKMLAEKSIKGK